MTSFQKATALVKPLFDSLDGSLFNALGQCINLPEQGDIVDASGDGGGIKHIYDIFFTPRFPSAKIRVAHSPLRAIGKHVHDVWKLLDGQFLDLISVKSSTMFHGVNISGVPGLGKLFVQHAS